MSGRVFDTSCMLTQIGDEPGADDVDRLLTARRSAPDDPETEIAVPFIALMEIEYNVLRRYSAAVAEQALAAIERWPVIVVESTPTWRHAAAAVKARYRLSVADAWIAALALMRDAELVHKDPEFDQLRELKVIRLPYKPAGV